MKEQLKLIAILTLFAIAFAAVITWTYTQLREARSRDLPNRDYEAVEAHEIKF